MVKKVYKFIFILFFNFTFINTYGYDLNFDLEAQFFYNNYIKNETYNYMASQTTLTAFDAIQKTRIKLMEKIDEIKLNFDARLYFKPDQNRLDYFIDSLYFSFENGPFILYAGKQRIKWGTGYTWNPTDKLQSQKNILDPAVDLEGFYALRFEYSNDFITPSFIISPDLKSTERDFGENFKFALQLYKLIGSADFFINWIYQMNYKHILGAAISYDADFLVLNLEGAAIRYMYIPEYYETYAYSTDALDWSYLIGFTKTIESNFFICAEYYYSGWGLNEKEFSKYIELYNTSCFGIKKRYLSLNISWTWDEKIMFSIVTIYGGDDNTILLYPRIEYVENSNFNFEIGFLENITDKDKESYYSIPVYNITSLKLKAYF